AWCRRPVAARTRPLPHPPAAPRNLPKPPDPHQLTVRTMPEALANLNGTVVPLSEATVPALDRGFLFGDAAYEGLRASHGKLWLQEEHSRRLGQSREAIRIGGVNLDRLQRRVLETIAAGPFREAIAYIQVTRGAAPRRVHPFPAGVAPLE